MMQITDSLRNHYSSKADVILNGNELKMFIHDLESVSIQIEQKFHGEIVRLISTLKQDKVQKVHIAGD